MSKLNKIQGLLALAKHNDNAHEAQAAQDKAKELMQVYGIHTVFLRPRTSKNCLEVLRLKLVALQSRIRKIMRFCTFKEPQLRVFLDSLDQLDKAVTPVLEQVRLAVQAKKSRVRAARPSRASQVGKLAALRRKYL